MAEIMAPQATKRYYFVVHTSDVLYAGTDSNIFVTLYGEKGTSESKRLNGNISGNAFERNDYDVFSVLYDHDVGEVYKIVIETDAKYAGSDWKCDYIHISTKKIDKNSADCCRFIINDWIKDSSTKYEYNVSSGYPYSSTAKEDSVVIESGEINVPPNATYEHQVKTSLTYKVDYSNVITKSLETSTQIQIDADVVKADFQMKINETIETASKITLDSTVEFVDNISISETSAKHRRYAVLWNESRNTFSVNMGSVNFGFTIPISRSFAGLKLIEEK